MRYLARLFHNGIVHPLLGLCDRLAPHWLLRLHDRTARYGWPEVHSLLPNGDLDLVRSALRESKLSLYLLDGSQARRALFLVAQAEKTLPPSSAERYDF